MPFSRLVLCALVAAAVLPAETGYQAWLRYAPVTPGTTQVPLPATIVTLTPDPVVANARDEMVRGIRGMLGRTLRVTDALPNEPALLLATLEQARATLPGHLFPDLAPDAYRLAIVTHKNQPVMLVTGANPRGVLYGAFALLRKIAFHQAIAVDGETSTPYAPIRWINQWDNLDGTIERGYGGRSLFFENDQVRAGLTRLNDYARLLASLGINGIAINNVNANPRVLAEDFLPGVVRIAGIFRQWGIQVVLSVDFGSPKRLGGLDTFDPLKPEVAAWWNQTAARVYRAIPDLAGFLMKADSEGRVGPSAYGRTHADAANTVARALAPHHGLLFYRAFVYDHHADWKNLKNDRARAAYDNFHPLDGKFDANVVIQIKNGPIDFQVREPASPLFAGLPHTNEAIELQVTQEYFGQARHMVYLVPYWKDTLDTDLRATEDPTPVKALAAGRTFHRPTGGFVGVANLGQDANWTGNHLSQANLYGFGRLAWNPDLAARDINDEWTRLTFGDDPAVRDTINALHMESWRTYENYTGPLGLQTLTAITGSHFGPAPEASERNGWGQWHRSDAHGLGMDRTASTGTGFTAQYPPAFARAFESVDTCPDDMLVFFHHVPYTHRLKSGKTVIQTLYDLHYAGAEAAAHYPDRWAALAGKIDQPRFDEVMAQLRFQASAAEEWRDAVNTWFLRTSGIADEKGRAGRFPGRIEAEQMRLTGYKVVQVTPFEAASGAAAIACPAASCSAAFTVDAPAGWYTIRVRYFDQNDGVSRFTVHLGTQVLDEWVADDHLPSRHIDSASSTVRVIRGIALRPGDVLRITGVPDGHETAAVDYVELVREQ